jgi:FtsZ-binding cell division protein ZapB
MLSLEHVQLLESRVAKAIEYIQRVDAENAALCEERAGLQTKLETNQKRLDELEMLVMRFKEDQGRIEDGIMAALNRLSQFEEAFENSLKEDKGSVKKQSKKEAASVREPEPAASQEFFEIDGETASAKKESEVSAGELDIF